MKKNLFILIQIIILISQCLCSQSENQDNPSHYLSFKFDGTLKEFQLNKGFTYVPGNDQWFSDWLSDGINLNFKIVVPGSVASGTIYTQANYPDCYMQYTIFNPFETYINTGQPDFSMTVSEWDADGKRASGSFEGTLFDIGDNAYEITEGVFVATIEN